MSLTCENSFLLQSEAGKATVNKHSVPVDLPHTPWVKWGKTLSCWFWQWHCEQGSKRNECLAGRQAITASIKGKRHSKSPPYKGRLWEVLLMHTGRREGEQGPTNWAWQIGYWIFFPTLILLACTQRGIKALWLFLCFPEATLMLSPIR